MKILFALNLMISSMASAMPPQPTTMPVDGCKQGFQMTDNRDGKGFCCHKKAEITCPQGFSVVTDGPLCSPNSISPSHSSNVATIEAKYCCKKNHEEHACVEKPGCMPTTYQNKAVCCKVDENPAHHGAPMHCAEGVAGPLACTGVTVINGKCCETNPHTP